MKPFPPSKTEKHARIHAEVDRVHAYLFALQESICIALESIEGQAKFIHDRWERPSGGLGQTNAMMNGVIIEKAGVNFSHVYGDQLPASATARHPELAGFPFTAIGLSLIVHPRNPYAPTTHFNLRFFLSHSSAKNPIWWFGGGFDLTPYYGFVEDCQHWHKMAKQVCDPFGDDLYPRFKKWADDYFYLKHRQESRGIGGLFFDDLQLADFETTFNFVRQVGDQFLSAYLPILEKRKDHPYAKKQRDFQCYRRGRYVEFNLIYDRGTLFGLQWGGRAESILISLPPEVNWQYNFHPLPGTEEAQLYDRFLSPQAWV